MMTDCRPIFADDRSASRTVTCHALIWPKHSPFPASGAENIAGHAPAPHALERELGFREIMRKHIRIGIPSGGCQLKVQTRQGQVRACNAPFWETWGHFGPIFLFATEIHK